MGDQLSVVLSNDRVMLMRGKSEEVLRQLVPECIDAAVCDPPYGLSKDPDAVEVLRHWLAGDDFQNSGGGFMGKTWDSFVPGPNVWREVYRLLKPGGYLLAFAGTRTMDLMSMAIRLAGFEIRDTLSWMYGTGFPKSMDVSKAIDKAATPEAQQWEGWGTALKPAWEPIIMARKPLIGTVAANVLTHGTGALNIDGTRIDVMGGRPARVSEVRTDLGTEYESNSYAGRMNDSLQPGSRAVGETSLGRWPANLLFSHHEECVEVGAMTIQSGTQTADRPSGPSTPAWDGAWKAKAGSSIGLESVEVFDCHEDCPVRMLDEQAGDTSSPWIGNRHGRSVGAKGGTMFGGLSENQPSQFKREIVDAGGPSRFFYRAKAPKSERNRGLPEGMVNDHPTVKPVEVMRWLVRMVTPPGGLVLDHYCGSGTTGVAAVMEGFSFVGIDRDDEGTYLPVAKHRIESVL